MNSAAVREGAPERFSRRILDPSLLRATLFLFACQGVGWAEMFLLATQEDKSVLKESRRTRSMLPEQR